MRSPAGPVVAVGLAVLGWWAGISLPWVIGAAAAAWVMAALLRLRRAGPFDRDVSRLDRDHRRYLTAGLAARDRFEEAIVSFGVADEFAGMGVRVDEALNRLYDSLLWAQRAAEFVRRVDRPALERRLAATDPGSPVAEELAAQLEEIEGIRARRRLVLDRAAATVSGLETLAVKMSALALDAGAPGGGGASEEVRALHRELDAYVDGLAEIEEELELPPGLA